MSELTVPIDTKRRLLGIGAAITFALGACSSESKSTSGSASTGSVANNTISLPSFEMPKTTALPTTTAPQGPKDFCAPSNPSYTAESGDVVIMFDDLDPDIDEEIQVYPSPYDTADARKCNGSYLPDTIVAVECIVEDGRFVPPFGAAPSVQADGSMEWFKLKNVNPAQFATKTFAKITPEAQATLPPCPAPNS